MTEIKRDLHADLAICSAATAGPWRKLTKYEEAIVNADTFSDVVTVSGDDMAYVDIEPADATFITEARTAWPIAIERAINAEAEVERLRSTLERISGASMSVYTSMADLAGFMKRTATEVLRDGSTQESGE